IISFYLRSHRQTEAVRNQADFILYENTPEKCRPMVRRKEFCANVESTVQCVIDSQSTAPNYVVARSVETMYLKIQIIRTIVRIESETVPGGVVDVKLKAQIRALGIFPRPACQQVLPAQLA